MLETKRRTTWRRLAAVAAATTVLGALVTAESPASADGSAAAVTAPTRPAASAASPTVSAAVAGAPFLSVGTFSLSKVGYTESEYFISGTASAYTNTSALGSDGKWSVAPSSTAPYVTRVVVLRPKPGHHFSGNVDVEWLNVSAGQDSPADWSLGHDEMIRNGDVWVGVSAQAVGVNALKTIDPGRYGSLSHPGDSYSYDIFSQAGQAVRSSTAKLLPGLHPTTILADGESQSAFRLTTYVNAVAPLVNVFDGYMIHSRSGGSSALSEAPLPAIPTPPVVFIRGDKKVPVLTFQTETDLLVLGYLPARQNDTNSFRLWETAGTAHADGYILQVSAADGNNWAAHQQSFSLMLNPPSTLKIGTFSASCTAPINTGEQHYVFQTALHDLFDWAATGAIPRSMPRLRVNTSTTPATYVKDSLGNVLGGVRSPAVDVPVATLSGLPPADAPGFCVLFGSTTPFSSDQISTLYPSHGSFVRRWAAAVDRDLRSGYLLPEDAAALTDAIGPRV
jgi:hypothetical protein